MYKCTSTRTLYVDLVISAEERITKNFKTYTNALTRSTKKRIHTRKNVRVCVCVGTNTKEMNLSDYTRRRREQ